MPTVPPPESLRSLEELIPEEQRKPRFVFWENLEARPLHFVPWAERTAGAPAYQEWYRFRPRATFSDPFADAARSLLLIDTMVWPACCRAYPGPNDLRFIAPSLDVNVQFHRLAPSSEWLLVEASALVANDGLVGGQARVWSEGGQLLASGGSHLLCRPNRM
jgi:acyl-CoA thioesterase-2